MRGCESEESEHESSSPLSRPLFKGKMARAPWKRPATIAMEPLEKVGPAQRSPRVGRPHGGPAGSPLLPGISSTVKYFETLVHGQSLLENMSKLFFPKDFKTQKIFLVFL